MSTRGSIGGGPGWHLFEETLCLKDVPADGLHLRIESLACAGGKGQYPDFSFMDAEGMEHPAGEIELRLPAEVCERIAYYVLAARSNVLPKGPPEWATRLRQLLDEVDDAKVAFEAERPRRIG